MKVTKTGILLNLLFATIPNQIAASQTTRQRYITHFPLENDPFINIDDIDSIAPQTILDAPYENKDWRFNTVELTDNEFGIVSTELANIGGVIVKDEAIRMIDDSDIMSIDDPNPEASLEAKIEAGKQNSQTIIAPTTYLNDAPKCNANVDNIEFVVLDSLVYKNISEFAGLNLSIGHNYVGNTNPCLDHGSKVISVIAGNNAGIIPYGKRSVVNIPVFDCSGMGYLSSMLYGFFDSIAIHKANLKIGRRTIVNFSGTAASNPVINRAATSLVEAGVPLTVAAGNKKSNACDTSSPANADKVFTTGATAYPGYVPAYFTNWAPSNSCIGIYLPGTVTVVDINTVNGVKKASGTSFGSPISAALMGMELDKNLQATPAELTQLILARTTSVHTLAGTFFDADMRLMATAAACTNSKLFNTYSTVVTDSGQFADWFSVPNINRFCVKFDAHFTNKFGSALIGLGQSINDANPMLIKIGIRTRIKNNVQYTHYIQSGNGTLAEKKTTDRGILINPPTNVMIKQENNTMLVQYTRKNKVVTLFYIPFADKTAQAISFSASGRGDVIYKNAIRC